LGFFEEQDRARRATARLVLLYALAVAAIVLAANAVVAPVYGLWFATYPGCSALDCPMPAPLALLDARLLRA
jgi:hypothetical protein